MTADTGGGVGASTESTGGAPATRPPPAAAARAMGATGAMGAMGVKNVQNVTSCNRGFEPALIFLPYTSNTRRTWNVWCGILRLVCSIYTRSQTFV